LATLEVSKKWTMTVKNWGRVYGELVYAQQIAIERRLRGETASLI